MQPRCSEQDSRLSGVLILADPTLAIYLMSCGSRLPDDSHAGIMVRQQTLNRGSHKQHSRMRRTARIRDQQLACESVDLGHGCLDQHLV